MMASNDMSDTDRLLSESEEGTHGDDSEVVVVTANQWRKARSAVLGLIFLTGVSHQFHSAG